MYYMIILAIYKNGPSINFCLSRNNYILKEKHELGNVDSTYRLNGVCSLVTHTQRRPCKVQPSNFIQTLNDLYTCCSPVRAQFERNLKAQN